MRKMFGVIALLAFSLNTVFASELPGDGESLSLEVYELDMIGLAEYVLQSQDENMRVQASLELERTLEEALAVKNSFDYPFSKVEQIAIQKPENGAFRTFTWQVFINDSTYMYRGFIQKKDGTFYKLEDKSAEMMRPEYGRHKASYWYGALYYNIKQFKGPEGKEMYLLFGLDSYSFLHRRKVLDVLYFDDKGMPRFGSKVIEAQSPWGKLQMYDRLILQYSASISVSLNYSENEDMVMFDHLIYGTPIPGQGPANVSDGSYCGLQHQKGVWKYVDKVYEDRTDNVGMYGDPPMDDSRKNTTKSKRDIFGKRKRHTK